MKKLTTPGRYRDERGLYLQVISATNRSWLFRYERGSKIATAGKYVGQMVPNERWMGLGPEADISLDEAREAARKARLLLREGIDPIDQRAAHKAALLAVDAIQKAKTVSFEMAAREYFEFHQAKWTNNKHRKQFPSTMAHYVYPIIGKLPVAEVDKTLVLKVLKQEIRDIKSNRLLGIFWKHVPETASRVRQRIEAVLAFATVHGYRDGENPARWKGHLDHALPARSEIRAVKHHRALPYTEMPDFMAALRLREGMAARALEFTILTAGRTGEIIGATWDEVDLSQGIWTVPGTRMKAGREHRVPLTKAALALLKNLEPAPDVRNPFVFWGQGAENLSNMAMDAVLRRMNYKDRATTHGFRSAFRDWAADQTTFPGEVAEMALAHTIDNKVEAAYRRGDLMGKRQKLMEAWASYCARPQASNSNVTAIRRAG